MPTKSGVYKITNKINNNFYIGSSRDLEARWRKHKKDLLDKKHHSRYLQFAVNLYGIESFSFSILLLCEPELCRYHEQLFINELNPVYNMTTNATGGAGIGHTVSRETRLKIGIANKGRKPWTYRTHLPDAVKEKISLSHKGKRLSEEHKKNLWKNRAHDYAPKKIWNGFISPDGVEFRDIPNLKLFCLENGLVYSNMAQVDYGTKHSHKDWRKIQ